MRVLKCCRTCLATDARTCPLEQYGLSKSYVALVGYKFDKNDQLPHRVCYECAHRLDAFRTFRKRSRRAHAVLQGLLEEHGEISAESLRKIDVTKVGLASSLLWCTLKPVIIEPVFDDAPYCISKLEEEKPGSVDIEINTDSKPEINLSHTDRSLSPEPYVDKLDHYVSFIPGPTGEDHSPEPEETQQNERKPKLGKVASIRKRVIKNEANGKKQTREDGPKKVKRVRKVKTENGDQIVQPKKKATEANKVKSDTTQAERPKKKRIRARSGAQPRSKHTTEYYKNFATVTILTDEQLVEAFSERQNSERYKRSPYQCTDCYRGFVMKTCYNRHRGRHDDPSQGSKVCKICKVRMKDVNLLKKHISLNHRTKFECKKCPYFCTSGLRARTHEAKHAEKHYPCTSCSLEFKSLQQYQMHHNKAHPTLLACPVCGHTFPGQGAVNRHRNNTHQKVMRAEYKVSCECGALFVSEEARGVHRSSHPHHADLDGNTSAIYCDFCEEKFPDLEATLTHRGSHMQVALALQSRECKECGLMLASRQNYLEHYRCSHPEKTPYKVVSRDPEIRATAYMLCEWCGLPCPSNAFYNVHLRSHTKEKPYQCNICNMKFSTKFNLERHGTVHTDDAPFSCDICGKYYKYKHAIRYHILHVHLKKPWPKRDRSKRNQKTSDLD